MDPEVVALSSAAATTLVTLMTTDAWDRVKRAFARLWRRCHPEQAGPVEADLDTARLDVIAARQAGDEQAELEVLGEWRSRLRRLIANDERLQDELRGLVEEFRPLTVEADQAAPVIMRATASGSGRVNQAGRDQTVISG